jgi:hypothetical protein
VTRTIDCPHTSSNNVLGWKHDLITQIPKKKKKASLSNANHPETKRSVVLDKYSGVQVYVAAAKTTRAAAGSWWELHGAA